MPVSHAIQDLDLFPRIVRRTAVETTVSYLATAVARFQHSYLFKISSDDCRGAVLSSAPAIINTGHITEEYSGAVASAMTLHSDAYPWGSCAMTKVRTKDLCT